MIPTDEQLEWAANLYAFRFLTKSCLKMFFEYCEDMDHFKEVYTLWRNEPHPDKCWVDYANETRTAV